LTPRRNRSVRRDDWERVKAGFQATIEVAPSERDAFLTREYAHDVELRAQIVSLVASHDNAAEFLETPAVALVADATTFHDAAMPRERIGPYRPLHEIGRGGMGTVYLATRDDGQFTQRVAIKLIKRGMDTDAIVARFRHERQILAALEHPNIARLLDGGTTDDGVPYFVMEYVEGQSISEYCATRSLPVRDRLQLFRTVCGAVHHAHRNLIVHRDIKSSNIVVSADGVPKLLDFGIAKLLLPSPDPAPSVRTETVGAMTPEYASPEQLRGEPVTTATDVYSLGVLLYELLAGQRPFASASTRSDAYVRAVSETDPVMPSVAALRSTAPTSAIPARQLRGDLDTIVLMAIRREPERRYSSVERFADDIARYLERRPVLAQRDTARYRLSKFVQRNRAALSVATMIFVTALSGVGATLWQARVARMERARAERRFAEIRSLATTFLFDVHDAIVSLPGSTPVRGMLVTKAVASLDGLMKEAAGDSLLERELSVAYQRLGLVQGNSYNANLGDTKSALTSYQTAVTLLARSIDTTSQNGDALAALSLAHHGLANLQVVTGDVKSAVVNLEVARAAISRAVLLDSGSIAKQRALADLYYVLGDVYGGFGMSNVGETTRALASYRTAVTIRERMLPRVPNDLEVRGGLANTLINLGSLELSLDDSTGSAHLAHGVQLLERIVTDNPDDAARRNNLLSGYLRQRRPLADAGRFADAMAADRQVLGMLLDMVKADPANTLLQRNLGVTYNTLGFDLVGAGRAAAAVDAHRTALAIAARLVASDPVSLEMQQDLSFTHHAVGDALRAAGRFAASVPEYNRALVLKRALQQREPENPRHAPDLVLMHAGRGAAFTETRNFAAANNDLQTAVRIAEPLVAQPDATSRVRNSAASLYDLMGRLHVQQALLASGTARDAHCAEARPWLQRSLSAWAALTEKRELTGMNRARPEATRKALNACAGA